MPFPSAGFEPVPMVCVTCVCVCVRASVSEKDGRADSMSNKKVRFPLAEFKSKPLVCLCVCARVCVRAPRHAAEGWGLEVKQV